ncbi:uncharacterized protein LOC143059361 [Mytilus galloprovincialis]|uniref:uncharacterized protein LOC143059361 n=1 Tax=Mytilus galloprovincialis TaxID=29158 RepID=UPI003F7BDAFC
MNYKASSVIKVNVVVVGDAGVGKSSLVLRFTKNDFPAYSSYMLGAFPSRRVLGCKEKSVAFTISEIAGSESFPSLFYRDAGIALILYDISSHQSFENVEKWLSQIQQNGPQDLKCALIGNKVDLDGNERHAREVETQEGQLLAEAHGWYFAETSALSGEGIDKVFHDMGSALVESCKKEKELPTVSLCDSYVHRLKKTCC